MLAFVLIPVVQGVEQVGEEERPDDQEKENNFY